MEIFKLLKSTYRYMKGNINIEGKTYFFNAKSKLCLIKISVGP